MMDNSLASHPIVGNVCRGCVVLLVGLITCCGWCNAWGQASDDPFSVDRWQSELQGDDLQLRRQSAIATLALTPDQQQALLPVLIELLLNEKDGQVRLAVLETVTEMGPAAVDAVEALAESIRTDHGGRYNEETHQDYRAALALAAIGVPAVETLRSLLDQEAANDRAEAAMALGRIGPDAVAAIDGLIHLLEDEQERVRVEASRALGAIGPAALEPLLNHVNHERVDVRAAVVEAIGRIEVQSDLRSEALKKSLSNEAAVRVASLGYLDSIGLSQDEWRSVILQNLQHHDKPVRLAAINALLAHPDRLASMSQSLSRLLMDADDGVAEHAAFLLQRLGPPAISLLIDSLDHETARVESIGRAIALMGTPAVESLTVALADQRPRVRQAAALALGSIRPASPDTVDLLTRGLADSDLDTREAFLTAIGTMGPIANASSATVQEMLNDPAPIIRQRAIEVLFQVASRDETMVALLTPLLNDPDLSVQLQALESLRALGPLSRPALPIVLTQLESPSITVRMSAAALIGSHGGASSAAVAPLAAQLNQEDASWRLTVITTLGQIGAAAQPAFEALAGLLDDPDPKIRAASVGAVGSLGLDSESLIPYLMRSLGHDDQEVRGNSLRIIRRLAGDEALILVPAIIPLAANEEEKRSVFRSLERLERLETRPESIPALLDLLTHQDTDVRRLAIRFVGLAGPAAITSADRLQPFLQDPDEEIQSEAQTAIQKIQNP